MQKIDPTSKSISNTVDQAVGPEQITDKFLTKYEELFNNVPTSDSEVEKLQNMLANNIVFDKRITPDIVRFCVGKLISSFLFCVLHSANMRVYGMFNAMLTHGFNTDYLLGSTIISTPNDSRGSMCSSDK